MFRTKASTYAILAVVEIAERQRTNPVGVQAAEIARRLSLPAAYAAKVLTQLARAGVLHSDRGPYGGFRLSRAPEAIDLLEIVETVDGAIEASIGARGDLDRESFTSRSVDQVFAGMVELVRSALKQQTVAGLLEPQTAFPAASQSR